MIHTADYAQHYFGLLDKLLNESIVNIGVDVDTLNGATALTTVEERTIDEGLDCVLEIAVRSDVGGILAA